MRSSPTPPRRRRHPSPPITDARPLPPVDQLLEAVEKHEDRDDAILQQYTYHTHRIIEEFDGNDAVKKTTVIDAESIPIDGVRVRRVVARNGKPLTQDEKEQEDAQFDAAVAKAKKDKAKLDAKKADAERSGKSNDNFIPASRILQLGDFANERRIDFNRRPTIVLDFAGRRDAKTRNEFEKAIADLVGTVWIDEQDKVIARAEGHFLTDFKIGGGLILDLHKSLSFTMEQQKINGEVWLPRQFLFRGKASLLVVIERVHGRTQVEMSDYRKFRTGATILGSSDALGPEGNPLPTDTPPPPQPTSLPRP